MSKTKSLTVSIRVKWWVQPYMFALRLAAPLIALALGHDEARIDRVVQRKWNTMRGVAA